MLLARPEDEGDTGTAAKAAVVFVPTVTTTLPTSTCVIRDHPRDRSNAAGSSSADGTRRTAASLTSKRNALMSRSPFSAVSVTLSEPATIVVAARGAVVAEGAGFCDAVASGVEGTGNGGVVEGGHLPWASPTSRGCSASTARTAVASALQTTDVADRTSRGLPSAATPSRACPTL